MPTDSKVGPLTIQDIINVWQSAVDPSYGTAFITAGEGAGFEAYTQAFAQYARASTAIDVSTQACYTLPWSGQSNPSAQGGQLAQVQLTFTRTGYLNQVLRLGAGLVFFAEQTNDWGQYEATVVQTGRRYVLQQDLVFLPGDSGPFTVTAYAEMVGYGFNNPMPNTITVIQQPGTQFYNDLATVAVVTPPSVPPPKLSVSLITINEPDTIIPQHVGQYMTFTAGANNGLIARIVGFLPPVPPLIGSTAILEDFIAFEQFSTSSGTFTANEQVTIKNGSFVVGTGTFVVMRPILPGVHQKYGIVLTGGFSSNVVVGRTITGVQSGAVATIDLIYDNPPFVAEAPSGSPLTGGASWRVMDWVLDWGLTITNAASPSGGLLGMLDGIGADKNLPRLQGETDAAYARRIATIADVVTPNAIKRTLYRVLGAIPWCFREVGTAVGQAGAAGASLPGFFYDRTKDENGDFYDNDVLIFNGIMSGGTFSGNLTPPHSLPFQEPVEYVDQYGNVKATGFFGRLDAGNTILTMIRISGQGSIVNPVVWQSNDMVRGLTTGAVFSVGSYTSTLAYSTSSRWHFYLDYTDFRAMFLIGVPRLDLGEFGFFFGVLPHGSPNDPNAFFDGSPGIHNFYDGYPYLNSPFYLNIYNAINRIKAGGVSFYLYQEDGTCV
jgi:hypothetical protein